MMLCLNHFVLIISFKEIINRNLYFIQESQRQELS